MTPEPVLYVHHRAELGGAPKSLASLIDALDPDRFAPHVYTPPGPAAALFRSVGATVHEGTVSPFTHIWASTYSGPRWLVLGRDVARLPSHVAGFRRVLSLDAFRIVHLNDSPLFVAAELAHRRGIPVVWHLRSALPEDEGRMRSRQIRATIRRIADVSIAINDDVAASFDVGARVIPNSVDLARFRPGDPVEARRALGLPLERTTIAFFGFMYPAKGYDDAIEAAGLLARRGANLSVAIVGGGVRDPAFFESARGRAFEALRLVRDHHRAAEERIKELGLADVVRFLPFTHEPEVAYQATDIVVAPSRGPELGRPVLEAAAAGRPVVASGSKTGGGVLVPGTTGLLVPPSSPSALADAIDTLRLDVPRRLRMGQAARTFAESEFDAHQNAARVMDVYETILARTRGPRTRPD